jgi:hypothetical protein
MDIHDEDIKAIRNEMMMTPDERLQYCQDWKPKVKFADPKDTNSPVLVLDRFVLKNDPPVSDPCGSLVFQIFHTDVKKLSSRGHLLPVDRDLRRPIFLTAAPSQEIHINWFSKNAHLFRAFRMDTLERIASRWVCFRQSGARSQSELHFFNAWLPNAMGAPESKPRWCNASVKMLDKQNAHVVCGVLLTPEQFSSVARGEKSLDEIGVSPPNDYPSGTTLTTLDGRQIDLTAEGNNNFAVDAYQKELTSGHVGTAH